MSEENPRPIRRLDTSVVNRIAAGEIIVQPANALKEMLENSIDAGSSHIDILAKDGGFKLLQITDNGCGIEKSDLPLLCERFATSKITSFEDLNTISTYGFRGEALASISHIARVSVITKTKLSPLAFRAFYVNGSLTNSTFQPSANVDPKPTAGKDGTQILVEDLFYNVPARLKTLKSKSEEFSRILDVVGRYAVHADGVSISCKRFGESFNLLNTRVGMPLADRIRTVFGNDIANELITIELTDNDDLKSKYGLIKVKGVVTNSNFNNKKRIQPVFFINNRLVSCDPLKRAIHSVFNFFLPKHAMPFTYLSLEIVPQNLDVNIHPTKREVRFLYEEEIIDAVSELIHTALSNVDKSRKFKAQSIISGHNSVAQVLDTPAVKKTRQENKLVRVDTLQSRLRSFLQKVDGETFKKLIANEFTHSTSLNDSNGSSSSDQVSSTKKQVLDTNLDVEPRNAVCNSEFDHQQEVCTVNVTDFASESVNTSEGGKEEVHDGNPQEIEAEGLEDVNPGVEKKVERSDSQTSDKVINQNGLDGETLDDNAVNNEVASTSSELLNEDTTSDSVKSATAEFEEDSQPLLKRRKLLQDDANFKITDRKRFSVNLDSIRNLRTQINESSNRALTEIFSDLTFVGIVDEEKRLCCFQHDVKLFLCDYGAVLREFYYQIALTEFYNYGEYTFSQPVVLEDLLEVLNLNSKGILRPTKEVIQSIMDMKQMFFEYFRITLTEDEEGKAVISSLPMLIKEIKPNLSKLPYFIYRLGTRIDYSEEQSCLEGILNQIALLYIPEPIHILRDPKSDEDQLQAAFNKLERDKTENVLEHVLFPKIKQRFVATAALKDDVLQIADLPGLYRVFERC